MSDQRDRDENLAGPLRAALERAMHSPAGECPDPETLAAYFDRALSIDQQASCDRHLSTCSRCQALLAAVVRSEEPAGAPQHEGAWMGLFRWRWLVPATATATATATALAVWLVVDRPGSERSVEIVGKDTVANSAPAGQGATGESRPEERLDKDVEPLAPPRAGGGATSEQQSTARVPDRYAYRADSSAPVGGRAKLADAPRENNEGSAKAPSPAPPRSKESASVAPPPPSSATAVPAAATPESRREYSVDSLGKSASAPAMDQVAANASGGLVEIQSPDPRIRWRIGPFGIQRSNNAGASWSNQRPEPNTTLTAGASPSVLICWVAGIDGTVLRTIDATTWERLPAPTPADLIAIVASSQNEATVTAEGGQQYVTVDGGRTWRAR